MANHIEININFEKMSCLLDYFSAQLYIFNEIRRLKKGDVE